VSPRTAPGASQDASGGEVAVQRFWRGIPGSAGTLLAWLNRAIEAKLYKVKG